MKIGDRVLINMGPYTGTKGTVVKYEYYPPDQYVCNTTVSMDAAGRDGLFAERELIRLNSTSR